LYIENKLTVATDAVMPVVFGKEWNTLAATPACKFN
jgi:hypothetical protein